jgi:hypothetical protein
MGAAQVEACGEDRAEDPEKVSMQHGNKPLAQIKEAIKTREDLYFKTGELYAFTHQKYFPLGLRGLAFLGLLSLKAKRFLLGIN